MKFLKDPTTGKRVSRLNDASDVVVRDVPEWRIIDDELWERAQARLGDIRQASGADKADRPKFWQQRRAQHLLTGKVFCASCGGAFGTVGKDYLACNAARRQGTCSNRAGIRHSVLDDLILNALRTQLMQPDDVAFFVEEFTREWNRRQAEASASIAQRKRELEGVERKIGNLIDAIADGIRQPGLQQRLDELERRRQQLVREMSDSTQPAPALHPNLAEVYRQKVTNLSAALSDPTEGALARESLRDLIDRVVLHPSGEGSGLDVELVGAVASLVTLSSGLPARGANQRGADLFQSSVMVVAGTRFELMTFRL